MRMPSLFLISCLLFTFPAAAPSEEPKDFYAAIGYNSRTGEYWVSFGMPSKEMAESEITKRIKDRDKLTLASFKNCYCALAMSKDGKAFGVGEADTPIGAQEAALKECRKLAFTKCSVVVTLHTAQGTAGDAYSAIAYSPSTGRYGVAVAKASKSEAEVESVRQCDAKDAKTVVVAKNTCCALALGKDKSVYGVGEAEKEKEAQQMALDQCRKKTTDCNVVVTLKGKQ